ncbi:hypothetical protein J2R99_002555 [Rhodopseudomonas julia]|uniref:DUF4169 family protein n=1 Tax=Rhodopseudomonas julia TaxID=200617 RepID=A0ABU0C843_9BRAD|nr:DUF4169 family protein [Rhodopseudomonas julia]MDQ0326686.1 hypothetical protein [Rhodopseudomonas julia]
MAEIVNLRTARKRAARQAKEKDAAENRRRHGRSAAERQTERDVLAKETRRLEGHFRGAPPEGEEKP